MKAKQWLKQKGIHPTEPIYWDTGEKNIYLDELMDDFVSNRLEKLVMPTKERTKYLIVARISSWETKEYWYEFDDYNEALKELKEKREGFTSNVEIDFYEAHPIIGKI